MRKLHRDIYITGCREKGNVNIIPRLAIKSETDCFSLAIETIDRIPELGNSAAAVQKELLERRINAKATVYQDRVDLKEVAEWTWPF
jgi:xylulose-5-phosphate/fructose-6-phosphate phosphoketolase